MKQILRKLYASPRADLSGFREEHVRSARDHIRSRLESELRTPYRWLATCTVAVDAGRWGGERRRKRRIKLLDMLNTCRARLGLFPIRPKSEKWASYGLAYGYFAIGDYAHSRGISFDEAFL